MLQGVSSSQRLRSLSTAINAYSGSGLSGPRHEGGPRLSRPAALLLCASSAATTLALASRLGRVTALAEYSTASAAKAVSESARSTPEIVLYQYEVCPFCNKVRAYLDYHDLPYRVVEVDPLRKTELSTFDVSYRKVPIAVVDGEQVNGSGAVIERVGELVDDAESMPTEMERQWLGWLDDKLIHLIAPNIYRTARESLQTFEYIADNAKFSVWQRETIRYSGAAAMYFIGRKLKKKYEIEDERTAITEALREWTDAIKKGGGKFLDGRERPGVADISVYGVLKAIERFDTFKQVRQENEELGEWFDRTKQAVGQAAVTERE